MVRLALIVICALSACSPQSPAHKGTVKSPKTGTPSLQPLAKMSTKLSATQRTAIARTQVPVLLPADDRLAQTAFLTSEQDWFVASIEDRDVVITIEGNRTARVAPEIRRAFAGYNVGTRAAPRIGHNELIIEAAWLEDGIAWSVEVDCQQPDTNPRCTDPAFVRGLVKGLRDYSGAAP